MCITVNPTWHYNFVLIFVECLLKLGGSDRKFQAKLVTLE